MAEENQINLPFKNNENSNENNTESNQISQEVMSKEDLIKRKNTICSFLLIFLFFLEILFIILALVNYDDDKDKKKDSTDDDEMEQDERLNLGGLAYILFFGSSIIFSIIIIICTCINCRPSSKLITIICIVVFKGLFSGLAFDNDSEVKNYFIGFIIVNVIFFIIAIGFQIYIIIINKNL